MSAKGWHILREGEGLTLCRRLPARFDVAAVTVLPEGRATRYAHQIRQDLWRALRNVRGFSPVVQLERRSDGGWAITAGGQIAGRPAASITQRVSDVLENLGNRQRWIRNAARGLE